MASSDCAGGGGPWAGVVPAGTPLTTIDGSFGEGGGQLLRNACAYASILRKNVRIEKIRAGRKKPGLRRQHLVGLQLLERCCCDGGAKLVGGSVGSQEVYFFAASEGPTRGTGNGNGERPKRKRDASGVFPVHVVNTKDCIVPQRVYTGDTHTAGSICLLLQTVLPLGLLSPRSGNETDDVLCFILKGGTNASMAPQYDYFENIFLPTLKRCCQLEDGMVDASVHRRGFFPRGGGEVHVKIRGWLPRPLLPIRLTEFGTLTEINIRAFSGGTCPRSVAENLVEAAKSQLLSSSTGIDWKRISMTYDVVQYQNAFGSGSGILIVAKTSTGCLLGGSAVGSPKIPWVETARQAATEILQVVDNTSGGACVDEYLQDQLILYMAMADGVSEILTSCLTLHTRTAIWLAEQMCAARFEVTRLDEGVAKTDDNATGRILGRHVIRCHGIGFCSSSNL